ncbi:UDP-Glycosyltransferase/glycogen phosphorylase, partial [Lichtheimia hyalospora FSU 10163]
PKNILFGITSGGSSHHSWVMRILDELDRRGHNVTYATTDDSLRYSRQRAHIKTVSVGPSQMDDPRLSVSELAYPMPFHTIEAIIDIIGDHYPQNYQTFVDTIEKESIDAVICDQMSFPCFDAAKKTKRPLMISMMINEAPETDLPYINRNPFIMEDGNTQYMPYSRRFYEAFIYPVEALWQLGPAVWRFKQKLETLDIPVFESRWDNAVKLVNNLYGLDDARPLGPLVEHIGPIYNDHFDELTPELASFLDTHKRVVYVAFGQHAQSKDDQESMRVLQMLLNNYEAGLLDGFIWSATKGTPLPSHVITSSGTRYQLGSTQFSSIGKIVSWAPQAGILRHPSVVTFVSHSGLMSLFEALYHGKRILAYPFFIDQFPNAKLLERAGAILWLSPSEDRLDVDRMTAKLGRVLEDKDGAFQLVVNRYQALFQIYGRGAVDRAADIVEEVLYTADSNAQLLHRRDIARNLSFLKRNNYDLYLGLLTII